MHRTLLIASCLLLLASCRHAAPAKPPSGCGTHPLVITAFSGENALVEEDQYRHLVKEVSDELTLALRDRLADAHKFAQVSVGAECAPGGIRLESRVVSVIHKSRKYHYKIAGRVVECGTDRELRPYEIEEQSKNVGELSSQLADDLASDLSESLICETAR